MKSFVFVKDVPAQCLLMGNPLLHQIFSPNVIATISGIYFKTINCFSVALIATSEQVHNFPTVCSTSDVFFQVDVLRAEIFPLK